MKNGLTPTTEALISAMANFSPEYCQSLRDTLMGKSDLTLRQALGHIYGQHFANAKFVMSLPEWTGFWFVDEDNNISVVTHDDHYSTDPWFGDYEQRNDWVVVYMDDEIVKRIRIAKANG